MAGDPHRSVRFWAWRAGMDHCGTRNEEEKDTNKHYYFDKAIAWLLTSGRVISLRV